MRKHWRNDFEFDNEETIKNATQKNCSNGFWHFIVSNASNSNCAATISSIVIISNQE